MGHYHPQQNPTVLGADIDHLIGESTPSDYRISKLLQNSCLDHVQLETPHPRFPCCWI